MAKKKYIYNDQTLDYEEYKISWKRHFVRAAIYLLTAGILGGCIVYFINKYIGSPKEHAQAREIEFLQLQYEIMGDKIENIDALLNEMQDRDDNITASSSKLSLSLPQSGKASMEAPNVTNILMGMTTP